MPEPLPFEYRARQRNIPWEQPDEARKVLEQRDRELEDYLATLGPGGAVSYAFFHYGVKWTTGVGWESRTDAGTPGTLYETESADIDFFAKTVGGSSPNKFVEVAVPVSAVWQAGVEFQVFLDAAATSDHKVRMTITTDQSGFYSWDNGASQEPTILTGFSDVRGSIHFMHPMEAGSSISLINPVLDGGISGAEAIDHVNATVHIAYYCPATETIPSA